MFPTSKKLLPNSPLKSILEIWLSVIMVSSIVPSRVIQLQKFHGSKINFQFYQKLDQNIDLAINMVWFNSKFSEQRVVFLHFSIFLVKWCFFWSRFFCSKILTGHSPPFCIKMSFSKKIFIFAKLWFLSEKFHVIKTIKAWRFWRLQNCCRKWSRKSFDWM